MENIEKEFEKRRKRVLALCGDNTFENLDREFGGFSKLHSKMVFALAIKNEPAVCKHPLFKNINFHPELTGERRVTTILAEITKLRGEKIFMDIYDLCWTVAEKYINTDGCFSSRIY